MDSLPEQARRLTVIEKNLRDVSEGLEVAVTQLVRMGRQNKNFDALDLQEAEVTIRKELDFLWEVMSVQMRRVVHAVGSRSPEKGVDVVREAEKILEGDNGKV